MNTLHLSKSVSHCTVSGKQQITAVIRFWRKQ